MQNSPISFDLSKYLKGLEKRLSVVENRRPGTMYITEKIVTVDPETGVETIIGDLTEYGEERNGIKQWVNDTEPPPVPSAPIVSSNLGTISVTWDGGNVNNVPQAPDFKHITVYAHAEGSTRVVGTVRSANESIILPDPPYNVVHTFTFKSVDFNGNESAPSMMSAEVMATPLVEAPDITAILEDINERYDGVITDSLQLNDKLAEARTDIDSAQESLLDLETVRLPQVEANIEAAHQEIVTTGAELDARLAQAEIDLNEAETGLNNLKNTELPAMKAQIEATHQELVTTGGQLDARLDQAETDLDTAEAGLNTLKNTDLPALKQRLSDAETEITTTGAELGSRLDQAETDLNTAEAGLNTLKNTTLPALNQRLADAETEINETGVELGNRLNKAETDLTGHNTRISSNESKITTLNNTTLPGLSADLSGAKTRLTAAEGEIATAKGKLSTAEGTLNTLKNTTIPALNTEVAGAKTRLTATETEVTNAKTRIGKTETDLTSAFGQITAVDTKAGNAQTAASNAQTAADSANTAAANAAGIAGSKGKVLVQSTAPGVADRNAVTLWIDTTGGANTPKRWTSGTTWVAVTDKAATDAAQAAATAKARADSAHTAAGNAQSTADSALTMAGSKNKVFYSTSNPSGTASVGDTWRKVNASNDVIAEWRWTAGNTWLTQQITSEVISNLDVGKLTAGSAIINTAVVNKIAIQTADVIKLNASAITAGTISADRLNVTDLAAKIATVIQLNADRITAGTIATGRLNATEVAAAVANVIQLNASRITAGTINTDRLNANEIAAKVATVIQLNASRITAGTISTDRLDVNDIAAKTASFQQVDVKNLFATSGKFSEAVIEKLWAEVIRAKKITTDQLLVGQGTNFLADPDFDDPVINELRVGGRQWNATKNATYGNGINTNSSTTADFPLWNESNGRFSVEPDGVYALTIYANGPDQLQAYLNCFYEDGYTNSGPTIRKFEGINGGAPKKYTVSWDMSTLHSPDGAPVKEVTVNVRRLSTPSGQTSFYNNIYSAWFGRMTDGALIVTGSITADHIESKSVAAELAEFINLDVSQLVASNAKISDLVVEKLWADVIRAKKITTDQLLVGSGSNLIVDPYFEDETTKVARATLSNMSGGYGRNATTNLNWFGGTQTAGTVQTYYFSTINSRTKTDSMIPHVEGAKYRFKFLYNSTGGGARPVVSAVRKDGTSVLTASGFTTNGVFTGSYGSAGSGQTMEAIWEPQDSWNYAYFIPGIQWESTVTSAHIYGGASVQNMSDGNLIVSGSIDADKINTNSVVAEVAKFIELDVSKLKVTAGATMNEAVIEKLWTDVVRSKKITTDQLLVGQGENLVPWDVSSRFTADRTSNIVEHGSTGNKISAQAGVGVADGNHLYMDANWVTSGTSTSTWRIMSDPSASPWQKQGFKVEPEEEFQAQIYVKAGGSYASGMPSVALAGVWYKADGTYIVTNAGTTSSLTWSWDKREVSLKAPATAAYLHLYIRQTQPGGLRVDLPSLYRKKGASLIVDGSITAKQIDAESVSAEVAKFIELDVSKLTATNASMNTTVINKLWADVVRARKITTDMMVVGSGGNHFPDPLFTDPDGWSYSDRFVNSAGRNGGKGLVVPASTGQSGMYYGSSDRLRQMPVIGGQEYRVGVWVKSSVTIPVDKITIYVKYTTPSSTTSGSFATNIRNTGVDGRLGAVPANTWRFLEGITKMPDTAEQAFIGLYAESGFNAAVTFSEPSVQTAAGTGLIVENGIQAKHIEASESMSAKLGEFLTLNAENFNVTGTGKMSEAVITKLWSDVVMSKKITADMMVVGGTNNLIPNANVLKDLAGWEASTANVRRITGSNGPDATTPYMYVTNSGNIRSTDFEVAGGNKFRFQIKAQAAATGSRFFVQLVNNGTGNPYIIENKALTTSWVTYSGEVELPEDATKASISIYVNHSNGSTTTQRFAFMSLIQMASGELIVDGAITAIKIKTSAIESDKIKANAITADKIDVGAIKAEHISAREITADKLRIGHGSNVFPDPLMKDTAGWPSSVTNVYTGGVGSSNRVRVTATSGQTGGYYGNGTDDVRRFPVVRGRTYVVSVWIRPTVNIAIDNVIGVYTRLVKETGSGFIFTSPGIASNDFQTTGYGLNPETNKRTGAIPANTWVRMEGKVSVPADSDYTFMVPGLYLQSGFPTGSSCDFSNLNISEAVTGELIVEGSITTDKLKAGAITADKLDSDAITGKKITGGTITGAAIIGGYIRMDGGPEVWQPSIRMGNDSIGAYLGFGNVGDVTMGTVRALNESGTMGGANPRLEIKSPSAAQETRRSHLTLNSGWNVGGRHDVAKKPWVDLDSDIEFSSTTTISTYNNGDLKFIARGSDLRLSSDTSQGAFVQSNATYDRTYSTSAAMCITGSGVFGRTISALKYKQDVETVNPEDYEDLLLSIDHKSWIDKSEAERYSEYVTWEKEHPNQPIPEEMMEYPTKEPNRHYGAIADDFHDAGLGQYVHYDTNGDVDGLAYERIGVALIPIVRTLKSRVSALEDSYESQKQLIVDLTSRLSVLESESTP